MFSLDTVFMFELMTELVELFICYRDFNLDLTMFVLVWFLVKSMKYMHVQPAKFYVNLVSPFLFIMRVCRCLVIIKIKVFIEISFWVFNSRLACNY